MSELYIGRGNAGQFEDYIDFLNYVFGFDGREQDFKKLLPKLYKKEYDPTSKSYLVVENEKIKAAVGVYESGISVCGMNLRGAGVGNVAVHPYASSKGYMKKLMHMALEDMKKGKIDYTVLGGQRQRYNYFSYENVGISYRFRLTEANMRHCSAKPDPSSAAQKTQVKMELVEAHDAETLDMIAHMYQSQKYVPKRERTELYNILCSWGARPYVFKENEKMIGYCVLGDASVSEILVDHPGHLLDAVWTIVAQKGSVDIVLPDFLPEYLEILEAVAEETMVGMDKMFSVLCFARVIRAFMTLKAGYTTLPDGAFTALIHGCGGDEKLFFSVKENVVTVEDISADSQKEPEIELSHLEAMRFFFAPVCEKRRHMPYYVQGWFPLPLWMYSADNV